ncbi:MAG: hypothetical protein NTW87_31335, partial [Planctomycetota bacterium]|nr:hypothetical protein [Planctomycetota bacterium]
MTVGACDNEGLAEGTVGALVNAGSCAPPGGRGDRALASTSVSPSAAALAGTLIPLRAVARAP